MPANTVTLSKEAVLLIAQIYALTFNEPDSPLNAGLIQALVGTLDVHMAALPGHAVLPAPTIASFAPASGKAGSTVVILGTGFTIPNVVLVNGSPVASFRVNSSTKITAILTSTQTTGLVSVGGVASATAFTIA